MVEEGGIQDMEGWVEGTIVLEIEGETEVDDGGTVAENNLMKDAN